MVKLSATADDLAEVRAGGPKSFGVLPDGFRLQWVCCACRLLCQGVSTLALMMRPPTPTTTKEDEVRIRASDQSAQTEFLLRRLPLALVMPKLRHLVAGRRRGLGRSTCTSFATTSVMYDYLVTIRLLSASAATIKSFVADYYDTHLYRHYCQPSCDSCSLVVIAVAVGVAVAAAAAVVAATVVVVGVAVVVVVVAVAVVAVAEAVVVIVVVVVAEVVAVVAAAAAGAAAAAVAAGGGGGAS